MAYYRVYQIGRNGRIVDGTDIEASDDIGALAEARCLLAADGVVEVWSGARCLGNISNDASVERPPLDEVLGPVPLAWWLRDSDDVRPPLSEDDA